MRQLSNLMPDVTQEALGKKGLLFGKLLQNWAAIIGAQKATLALPVKVSFYSAKQDKHGKKQGATLTLSCNSADATLLQHEQAIWIEKINLFFGYEAVSHIKILHSRSADMQKNSTSDGTKLGRREARLNRLELQELEEALSNVEDENLKEALKKLGQSLYLDLKKK